MAQSDPLLGRVLDGKYRLEALLGAGGMGTVYRATQLALNRPIAVKVVRSDAPVATSTQRFEREALIVGSLRHPNIVTIHDFGSAADVGLYIVMEYLEGRSLRDELNQRGRIPPEETIRLIEPVCRALGAAHQAGVVHRDLKPDNIFIAEAGGEVSVKVLDFGLAKLLDADPRETLTASGTVAGTVAYMSPEQCRGEDVDARSDVYSLGCVLYEMIAGRPPFLADTAAGIIGQHLSAVPERPSRYASGLPPSVERAVLLALVKRPGDRFATVAELLSALSGRPSQRTLGIGERGEFAVVPASTSGETLIAVPPARLNVPNNLTAELTPLVGRERELSLVLAQLERPDVRLLTLTGVGGTGKTRLALEAAHALLADFPGGVYFVGLATVRDPALLAPTIMGAVGAAELAGAAPLDSLVAFLSHGRVLLLLDNFEQVVDSAPLVSRLLSAVPRLKVLVTSRASLRLSAEREFAVPPLELPPRDRLPRLEELEQCPAVALFVERARAAKSTFALTEYNARPVAEICRKLDGLPLAIELAAARVKLLSPQALLSRLGDRLTLLSGGARDLPERQQTMRDAIAWSYELLHEEERALFRRLSVFAGGFTLGAAETICSRIGIQEVRVLEGAAALVENSLLYAQDLAGETRLRMLEVIGEYASERLQESAEAPEVRRRHAELFLELAERAASELRGAQVAHWLKRVDEEKDNLRAALQWLSENDSDACLRLCVAMAKPWVTHGRFGEGRMWLNAALEGSDNSPPSLRARALRVAGSLARWQGDLAGAGALLARSLGVADAAGENLQAAAAKRGLGEVAINKGDLEAARDYLEQSLATGRELGDTPTITGALNSLGELRRLEGDYSSARLLYEEALGHHRRLANRSGLMTVLFNLGFAAYQEGDFRTAGSSFREAFTISRELGNKTAIMAALDGFAGLALKRGEWEHAARLAGAAEGLRATIGYELDGPDRQFRDSYFEELRAKLAGPALEAALADGRALSLEQAISVLSESEET